MEKFSSYKGIEIISYIESTFPVNEWEVNNLKVWPLIRIKLGNILAFRALEVNMEESIQRMSKAQLFKRFVLGGFLGLYHSLKDLKGNANPFKKKNIVFLGDGVSFTKLERKWFNKYCDPIRNDFAKSNDSTVTLETWIKYYGPRFLPSFFIQPFIDWAIVFSVVLFNTKKCKSSFKSYPAFLSYLKNIDVNPDNFSEINVQKHAFKVNKLANLYKYFLRKIEPDAGLVVCYYGDYMMGFILACKQLGIPTFDIQHGVQGENHLAYNSWVKIPNTGYDLLPDYFLCWSDYEAAIINGWSKDINCHKAIVIGNRFLEMWRDPKSTIGVKYDNIFNQIFKNERVNILLSLSWDINSETYLSTTLAAICATQHEYNWLIRLHPSMFNKQEIIQMLNNNGIKEFEIEQASVLPLYTLLRNVQINITHSSSTVIEAAEFAVPSIITSDYGWELYSKQIESKWIYKIDESKRIIEHLLKLKKTKYIDKPYKKDNLSYMDKIKNVLKPR